MSEEASSGEAWERLLYFFTITRATGEEAELNIHFLGEIQHYLELTYFDA